MTTRQDELERFKTDINLTEYAVAELGFRLDRTSSSRSSVSLKHPNGDKIIVAMDGPKWVYFSVGAHHRGSIIDLVQHHKRLNLGQVRKELRPWLGRTSPTALPASAFVANLEPTPIFDRHAVLSRYEAAACVEGPHPYLTTTRGIPASLIVSRRFAGCIRSDDRGAALFGHHDDEGLCGFEIKNHRFTGFAGGGIKGLWCSAALDGDTQLVIAETAIDALSHAALRGFEHSRYVSIAGAMNPTQPGLLKKAMADMPAGARIVIAFDNDEAGDRLTIQVRELFGELDRSDLELVEDRPPERGTDWNDLLKARSPQPLAGGRPEL